MDPGLSSSTPTPQPYYDTPVSFWEPAQHDKKSRKDDWGGHASGLNVTGDENSRTPREYIPTSPTSFDYTHGKWRQAKVRLFCDLPRHTPYDAPNKLVISFPDSPYPLDPIYIYRLFQSDIRRTHYSVFCQSHVIGIHRRAGQTYSVPPVLPTADTLQGLHNAPGSHGGSQTSSPWPSHFLQPQASRLDSLNLFNSVSSLQSNDVTYPPIYMKFSSAEVHDTWLSLFHAYSIPETFVNGVPSLPIHDEEAAQYRKWRGLSLNIDWLDGLDGSEEGGARDGPSSSSNKESLSGSHLVDYDFYCDILLDDLLVGRTTVKRWSRPANSPMRVDWHERFELSDLPSLGNLQLLIWRMKAEKLEKERSPMNSSGPDGQRQRLTSLASSSISAGVALISHAVGFAHKERQQTCLGQVQLALSDFTRGEVVDGKWEVTSFGSRIPWRIGPPLTTWLKIKVDECNILPLKEYSELSSFLKPSETFLLLDQSGFTKGKGTPSFQKACLPTLQRCLYDLSVEDSTIIQDASHILTLEIVNLWEKTAAHPGSSVNNTLFRSGAVHSKVVELMMSNLGREWLVNSLSPFIQEVIAEKSASKSGLTKSEKRAGKEGSGTATPDHGSAHARAKIDDDVLMAWCDKAWRYIWNARDQCPNDLRQIFFTIRTEIENRFNLKPARRLPGLHSKPRKDYSTSATAEDSPDYRTSGDTQVSSESKYENFKFQIISGFAFLRFFSPALLSPHLYNLSNGRLDENVGDILKVVARALQQLANLTPGHSTEVLLQQFSRKYSGDMVDYLQSISTVLPSAPSAASATTLPANQASNRETSWVSPAVTHALQSRLESLPPLHRESVPALPHLVDPARCLAIIASTVARHVRDDDVEESTGPTPMATQWQNFQSICLRVEERRIRSCRVDPSNSPDEDERSFTWAVDEDAPASPVPDAEERASTKPETEQRMDNAGRQPALASPQVIEPSPAISQISTFTNHTLSHYLDYYLQNDEAGDAERTDPPEVEYRPRSSRRPSTAPAAQRISQFSGLPTTFESGAVDSPSHGSHEPSQWKQGPAKGTTHGEGNPQPRASRSALANDFASQTPSVQSGATGRREKRAPRDLLDKSE